MTKPVILVCGFGRCGSSLLMQMLAAGDIPVTGEWPGFEDDRVGPDFDPAWIAAQHGRAVKLLDPQLFRHRFLPGDYRVIWLDRDRRQQARSQAKFIRAVQGLPIDRRGIRRLAASYRRDRPVAMAALRKLGPVLTLRFEDLLTKPFSTTGAVLDFLEAGGEDRAQQILTMADAIRMRSPAARPDMALETQLLREREARS